MIRPFEQALESLEDMQLNPLAIEFGIWNKLKACENNHVYFRGLPGSPINNTPNNF